MTSRAKRPKTALPFVFTEHGALMLASVLRSEVAVEISIKITRAFVAMRQTLRRFAASPITTCWKLSEKWSLRGLKYKGENFPSCRNATICQMVARRWCLSIRSPKPRLSTSLPSLKMRWGPSWYYDGRSWIYRDFVTQNSELSFKKAGIK